MNPSSVIVMTRSLTKLPSRRDVLRSLTGVGLALSTAWVPERVDAKKKRNRKRKKNVKPVQPNEFGCFEVGDPCQSADDCCSGLCEGKKCRAHGTDICRQDRPGVCTAPFEEVPQLGCSANCWCFRTTAGSNYCSAAPRTGDQNDCTDCKRDADCEALGYPLGSACVQVGRGNCAAWCESGMACLVPCGAELPDLPA